MSGKALGPPVVRRPAELRAGNGGLLLPGAPRTALIAYAATASASLSLALLNGPITAEPCRAKDGSLPRVSSLFRPPMVEAPGTAPGSTTLMPRTVYRHSRR